MDNTPSFAGYFLLFIPWGLSLLFMDYLILSYLTAWLGSFFIFYISMNGRVKPLPGDQPFAAQLLRPIILGQIIFAGYMCCTSVFYFFDVFMDSRAFGPGVLSPADEERLSLAAQCQRYYCLAHAAFVSGLLIFMRQSLIPKYTCPHNAPGKLVLNISLICGILAYLISLSEGLSQFSHQLTTLGVIAGTLALALAIVEKNTWRICLCLIIYGLNFYHALLSGFKEPVILSVLILAIFLYPAYPKMAFFTFAPLLLALFILLPTYNRIFREQAWSAGLSATQAGQLAFNAVFESGISSNWSFLSYRLSEIHMFTKYVQSTPSHVDHYGFDLIQQSLASVIPRLCWPSKPVTEQLVMERVHRAAVTHPDSKVSAKPAFIADAYLSGGAPGIFICLFSYGALCQLISNKAEQLFGGYLLGIALIFSGLFQVFWRGQCFEFLLNTVCWSYVSMYLIFYTLRFFAVLIPAKACMTNSDSQLTTDNPQLTTNNA